VVSNADFINEVNQSGLVEEYIEMSKVYRQTSIFPKSSLRLFHKAKGINYFLKPGILQLQQRADGRLSVFSLRLIVTRETSANVNLEIWNARTGSKVWEGAAGCTVAGEKLSEKRIAPQKVLGDAWKKLVEKLYETVGDPSANAS